MRMADRTVTLLCRRYNGETDTDTEYRTVLGRVSCHAQLRAAAGAGGLAPACVYSLRIFAGCSTATTAAGLSPAPDSFLPPGEWEAADEEVRAAHWTLRTGDRLLIDGRPATVLAVSDDRGKRQCPHWRVEAG